MSAASDRDVLLHVLQRLGVRYDDVFPHPECPAEVSIRRIDQAMDRLSTLHADRAPPEGAVARGDQP